MAYQVVMKRINPQTKEVTFELVNPFKAPGYEVGPVELRACTNGVSHKPDPQVFWPSGRWVHLSTLRHWGYEAQDTDTGGIVEIADSSECCEAHAKFWAAQGGQHAE